MRRNQYCGGASVSAEASPQGRLTPQGLPLPQAWKQQWRPELLRWKDDVNDDGMGWQSGPKQRLL